MKSNYNYQIQASKQVLANALNSKYLASVLAAAPGSGKTTISHLIINDYIALNPTAKILVLTHGQNLLKNQYLSELMSPNVSINFTFGDFSSDAQVRVGIPQSIKDISWDKIDLLIIDEAHAFYGKPMVNKIISKLNPTHRILMTGSPSRFNAHNNADKGLKYGIHYISVEDLEESDVFSSVIMDVSKEQTISGVMKDIKNRSYDDRKMMIAVSTISEAETVKANLNTNRPIMLSTSENDEDSEKIESFKRSEDGILIVVNRGVLGFNDPNITCLVDMRSSSDLEITYQLFARVLRKHPENIKKTYIRTSGQNFNKEVLMLHKLKAFMGKKVFSMYDGKNLVRV